MYISEVKVSHFVLLLQAPLFMGWYYLEIFLCFSVLCKTIQRDKLYTHTSKKNLSPRDLLIVVVLKANLSCTVKYRLARPMHSHSFQPVKLSMNNNSTWKVLLLKHFQLNTLLLVSDTMEMTSQTCGSMSFFTSRFGVSCCVCPARL